MIKRRTADSEETKINMDAPLSVLNTIGLFITTLPNNVSIFDTEETHSVIFFGINVDLTSENVGQYPEFVRVDGYLISERVVVCRFH